MSNITLTEKELEKLMLGCINWTTFATHEERSEMPMNEAKNHFVKRNIKRIKRERLIDETLSEK